MQQLLNPFAQKYPDKVDTTLASQATCVKFNSRGPFAGHYLAAGGLDGTLEIWDVETRGIARIYEGHVKPVTSVCWSRNNRYVLTGSVDSTATIWDLSILATPTLIPHTPYTASRALESESSRAANPRIRTIRFQAPVTSAIFHPRNSKILLATLSTNEVVLVDLRMRGPGEGKYVLEDMLEGEGEGMAVDGEGEGEGGVAEEAQTARKKGTMACAAFSPCGSRIYVGTTQGMVIVIDPFTRYVVQRVKVANSAVRQIAFDLSGRNLILGSTDRALRVLLVSPLNGQLTATHRFQDAVNRTPWHSCGFSGDGEYVMGGAGHKAAHNIYVWDRDSGGLVKVTEGPKEPLVDSDWHPTRPVIASVGTSGDIHLWQTSSPDNWAAFAPGFEELEENVEYDEREDEFDIEDETDLIRRKDAEEDLDIDILKTEVTWPQTPDPIITLPRKLLNMSTGGEEMDPADTETARAVVAAGEVLRWAEVDPDDDTWEGFYLSVDLINPDFIEGDMEI